MMSVLMALLLLAGAARSQEPRAPATALDRIPADQINLRRNDAPVPATTPITGPWQLVMTRKGVRTWEAPMPVRPRTLFFHRAPGDMEVLQNGDELRHANYVTRNHVVRSWSYSSRALQVRRPIEAGPPQPGEYSVRFSLATARESDLRFTGDAQSLQDKQAFVARTAQLDDTSRSGLFLPAPAEITFTVDVPSGAVLDLTPVLLPPEAGDPMLRSDGARLTVFVDEERVVSWPVDAGVNVRKRVLLSPWAGEDVSIRLVTEPGRSGDASLDYVFIGDPVVFKPTMDPRRVVVLFVDTLRADHMSLYGYERQTTPRLDRWAEQSAVFEQARSIAPWTLPSARTMMTGTIPERWDQVDTIQGALSKVGWATSFIAGNVYLSSKFENTRGWANHRCVNWPLANVQVNRALDYLNENSDRDVFLMLHFMDMHLPYTEPPTYRYLYAGDAPAALSDYEFHLTDVRAASRKSMKRAERNAMRQYVRDRYDNNLRFIDDQLSRFLSHLDPARDTVLLIADHGEEFWDHGGFEHGHTLYDELLRVPMIARGPGLTPGRYPEPTSLLDVAPTIAYAAGVSLETAEGLVLHDLTAGDSEPFTSRKQAFGRKLYGDEIWGSLDQNVKYITRSGVEKVYDLGPDPKEKKNLRPDLTDIGRAALSEAMGTPVPVGFRLDASRSKSEADLVARVRVPGGVKSAWVGTDPTRSGESAVITDDDGVIATFKGDKKSVIEVFFVPVRDPEEVLSELELIVEFDGKESSVTIGDAVPFEGKGKKLMRATAGSRTVTMTYMVMPEPLPGATRLDGTSLEVCFDLAVLGYTQIEDCLKLQREQRQKLR